MPVLDGCLCERETPNGFDLINDQEPEFLEIATEGLIDHDASILRAKAKVPLARVVTSVGEGSRPHPRPSGPELAQTRPG